MQKSIVAANLLKKGKVIEYEDLSFKSPGGGLKPYQLDMVINKKLKKEIQEDEFILTEDLE